MGDALLPPLACSPTSTMAPIQVKIKHAGKTHDVQLDPDQPATVFKDAVYQLTGVPPDRMKVMIKGGILKVRLLLSNPLLSIIT